MSRPVEITPEFVARWRLPPIPEDSDKEARGRVLVVGAGLEVAGATVLSAVAALRAGAGKLQIAAPRSLAAALALKVPEARVLPFEETARGEIAPGAAPALAEAFRDVDAALIGPGMLEKSVAAELALSLAEAEGPALVVDAVAAVGLARDPERAGAHAGRLLLTPHMGEMAALNGCEKAQVEADPVGAARAAAARFRAVVALKGAETFVASSDGQVWRRRARTVGLATSGSGDVLAGVIAGLLARGAAPAQATVWGVHVHGEAGARLSGRIGRMGFLARELLGEIAPAIDALERPGGP